MAALSTRQRMECTEDQREALRYHNGNKSSMAGRLTVRSGTDYSGMTEKQWDRRSQVDKRLASYLNVRQSDHPVVLVSPSHEGEHLYFEVGNNADKLATVRVNTKQNKGDPSCVFPRLLQAIMQYVTYHQEVTTDTLLEMVRSACEYVHDCLQEVATGYRSEYEDHSNLHDRINNIVWDARLMYCRIASYQLLLADLMVSTNPIGLRRFIGLSGVPWISSLCGEYVPDQHMAMPTNYTEWMALFGHFLVWHHLSHLYMTYNDTADESLLIASATDPTLICTSDNDPVPLDFNESMNPKYNVGNIVISMLWATSDINSSCFTPQEIRVPKFVWSRIACTPYEDNDRDEDYCNDESQDSMLPTIESDDSGVSDHFE